MFIVGALSGVVQRYSTHHCCQLGIQEQHKVKVHFQTTKLPVRGATCPGTDGSQFQSLTSSILSGFDFNVFTVTLTFTNLREYGFKVNRTIILDQAKGAFTHYFFNPVALWMCQTATPIILTQQISACPGWHGDSYSQAHFEEQHVKETQCTCKGKTQDFHVLLRQTNKI